MKQFLVICQKQKLNGRSKCTNNSGINFFLNKLIFKYLQISSIKFQKHKSMAPLHRNVFK
jgi:hypothetical protein